MSTKVRKQIYLTAQQIQAIQERAEALGTNESEYIRRAVDAELRGHRSSFRPDFAAWRELRHFLISYQPASSQAQPYQFNREEIYDERLGRFHADIDG
jgi:hypothetical protein